MVCCIKKVHEYVQIHEGSYYVTRHITLGTRTCLSLTRHRPPPHISPPVQLAQEILQLSTATLTKGSSPKSFHLFTVHFFSFHQKHAQSVTKPEKRTGPAMPLPTTSPRRRRHAGLEFRARHRTLACHVIFKALVPSRP